MAEDHQATKSGESRFTTITETENAGIYRFGSSDDLIKLETSESKQSVSIVEPHMDTPSDLKLEESEDGATITGGTEKMIVENFKIFRTQTSKCAAGWAFSSSQTYTHRYEGASVLFVNNPKKFEKGRLEDAISAISETIYRQTRLGGWGLFPLTTEQIHELTSRVGKQNSAKVTMGGWDTDKFDQFGPTAMLQFGLGAGLELDYTKLTSLWKSSNTHMTQIGGFSPGDTG